MIQTLVRDSAWIHLAIGMVGNFCFVVGSVLFFKMFDSYYTLAVWLFLIGSAAMFIGSLGEVAKSLYERLEKTRNSGVG